MNNEHQPLKEPIFLENGGKKYVYDFANINVEQAEIAREIGEFKYNQIQAGAAESPDDVIRSGGATWLIASASYLFLPVIDETPQIFDRLKVSETQKFISNLPISERGKIEEAVTDFFSNIGRSSVVSTNKQNARKPAAAETLLRILASGSGNEMKRIGDTLRSKKN